MHCSIVLTSHTDTKTKNSRLQHNDKINESINTLYEQQNRKDLVELLFSLTVYITQHKSLTRSLKEIVHANGYQLFRL